MSLLYRRISRLPNYLRAFGLVRGLILLFRVERNLAKESNRLKSYDVPWARAPIWLRETISDHAIFWQNIVRRHYEVAHFPHAQRLMATYAAILKAGRRPVILDCGGNIGLSAIWFAVKFPEARVLVVEPEPRNFELLVRNVAPYRNTVEPLQGGIWPRAGRLAITNPKSGASAFQVQAETDPGSDSVRAFTIDDLLRMAESTEAFIVKLDIEGSQRTLFEENTDWVGRCHLIILELDDWLFPWAGTSRSFFRCISRLPFEYLIAGEHIFCFRDFSESIGADH